MHNVDFKAVHRWYIRGWGVSKKAGLAPTCLVCPATLKPISLSKKAVCLILFMLPTKYVALFVYSNCLVILKATSLIRYRYYKNYSHEKMHPSKHC